MQRFNFKNVLHFKMQSAFLFEYSICTKFFFNINHISISEKPFHL